MASFEMKFAFRITVIAITSFWNSPVSSIFFDITHGILMSVLVQRTLKEHCALGAKGCLYEL